MRTMRKKGAKAMADKSTLLVREFPRSLRQQIHARAALEGKMLHDVIIALLEKALAPEEEGQKRPEGKRHGR